MIGYQSTCSVQWDRNTTAAIATLFVPNGFCLQSYRLLSLTHTHRSNIFFLLLNVPSLVASLERYLWPIRCNANNNRNNSAINGTAGPSNSHITSSTRDRDFQEFQKNACSRIAVGQFDERFIFREGYSVLQMMRTLATFQKFSDHKRWRQGFCFHSDWIWGYFVNYYNIASQVSDPRSVDGPESRIEAYRESELLGFFPELRRACNNEAPSPDKCNETSVVCHYQTPESMNRVINATRMMYPDRYRTLSDHEKGG